MIFLQFFLLILFNSCFKNSSTESSQNTTIQERSQPSVPIQTQRPAPSRK